MSQCSKCGAAAPSFPGTPKDNLLCSSCSRKAVEVGAFAMQKGTMAQMLGFDIDQILENMISQDVNEQHRPTNS